MLVTARVEQNRRAQVPSGGRGFRPCLNAASGPVQVPGIHLLRFPPKPPGNARTMSLAKSSEKKKIKLQFSNPNFPSSLKLPLLSSRSQQDACGQAPIPSAWWLNLSAYVYSWFPSTCIPYDEICCRPRLKRFDKPLVLTDTSYAKQTFLTPTLNASFALPGRAVLLERPKLTAFQFATM